MTDTLVARTLPQLRDFMEKLGGEMIVKPLHGKGGEGIFYLQRDDRNLTSILEQSTDFGPRWVMAQRYLPDVRRGRQAHPAARRRADRRRAAGAAGPRGAVESPRRRPSRGRPASTRPTAGSSPRVAPALRRDGLFFVGIDVIGGFLTEVNVTSPTGVQEINALDERPAGGGDPRRCGVPARRKSRLKLAISGPKCPKKH